METEKLLSDLLRHKTKKPRFKLSYETPEEAAQALFYAVQVEVESRGKSFNVDDRFNTRLSNVGRWLIDPNSVGLFMCGNTGSGKTTIMDAIINLYSCHNITHKGVKIGFQRIDSVELYQMYRSQYETFEKIKTNPLLAIDDLGVEPVYINVFGTNISPISELIYYRYQRQLTTIITTNLHPEDVAQRYGDRIADRFREMMTILTFSNQSYR